MEKLLRDWLKATAAAQFHEASAFCAPRGTRRAALHRARMQQQRAARLERMLRRRGVDPYEALRNGKIK